MKNLSLSLLIFAPLLISSCGPNDAGDEAANLNVNALEGAAETPKIATATIPLLLERNVSNVKFSMCDYLDNKKNNIKNICNHMKSYRII